MGVVEKQSKCGLQVGQSVSKISGRDLSSAAGLRAIIGAVGKQSEYGLQVGQSVSKISDRDLSSVAGTETSLLCLVEVKGGSN